MIARQSGSAVADRGKGNVMRTLAMSLALAVGAWVGMPQAHAADVVIDFSEGKWDRSAWTPIKVWPYTKQSDAFRPAAEPLIQQKDCLSVSFPKERIDRGNDNALMTTECLKSSGEIVLEFEADGGGATAPGICLFPVIGGDHELRGGFAVFVASATMAVWQMEFDETEKITRYKLLGRIVRWTDPHKPHTLRCRFGGNSMLFSVDDSEPLCFDLQPWFPAKRGEPNTAEMVKPNATVGIWGCHGTCKFYRLSILDKPTIPTMAVPKKEPPTK